jgi:hypothetical protein
MPSSKQRLEVWHGIRDKTSGGLRKSDLVKNKRGKIVSKRKSGQAHDQNNLKSFLREKGKSVSKDAMLHKKGAKKPPVKILTPKKKKKQPPKIAAKKPAPPKVQVQKKPAPKKKKLASKKKGNPDINPITKQPYAKKKAGYVTGAAMHIDNIRPSRRARKKRQLYNAAAF